MEPARATLAGTHELATWNPLPLVPGPVWQSFENFRRSGTTALDKIPTSGVGTLRTKTGFFRIMHDADFQRLVGMAADVQRLQKGLKVIFQAAKIVAKHPDDQETVALLIDSAMMVAQCPELPVVSGHDSIPTSIQGSEGRSDDEDADFELSEIPQLQW